MALPVYDESVLPCLVLPMGNAQKATKRYLGKQSVKQSKSIVASTAPHDDAQQALLYDFWNTTLEGGTLPFEINAPLFGTPTPRLLVYIVGQLDSSKNYDEQWVTRLKLRVFREQISIPSASLNFTASDNLYNEVAMTWDAAEGYPIPTYTLFKDTIEIGTTDKTKFNYVVAGVDTSDYYVRASNQEGFSDSVPDSGTALSEVIAPSSPSSFIATDNEVEQITFSWFNSVLGSPLPTYDLYRVETGVDTLIASNVSSPYTQAVAGGSIEDYYVRAVNTSGTADSNIDSGISIAVPAGTQEFLASGNFTVPDFVTEVTVCMIGGGGSGATSYNNDSCGGGYAGEVVTQAVTVTPGQVIAISIGAGGAAVFGSYSNNEHDGNAGQATAFGALTATGGAGGTSDPGEACVFQGDGELRNTCYGNAYNGLYSGYVGASRWGGQAGFGKGGDSASSFSSNVNAEAGVKGAGGGAHYTGNFGYQGYSGAGGSGVVKITWS